MIKKIILILSIYIFISFIVAYLIVDTLPQDWYFIFGPIAIFTYSLGNEFSVYLFNSFVCVPMIALPVLSNKKIFKIIGFIGVLLWFLIGFMGAMIFSA